MNTLVVQESTHPAPRARQPPHELSSESSSIHSNPTLNQSAKLLKLLSSNSALSGVISSPVYTGQATDPPGHKNEE